MGGSSNSGRRAMLIAKTHQVGLVLGRSISVFWKRRAKCDLAVESAIALESAASFWDTPPNERR